MPVVFSVFALFLAACNQDQAEVVNTTDNGNVEPQSSLIPDAEKPEVGALINTAATAPLHRSTGTLADYIQTHVKPNGTSTPTFKELINHLNFRTLNTEYNTWVSETCQSYLKDFFAADAKVTIVDSEMNIDSGDSRWRFVLSRGPILKLSMFYKKDLASSIETRLSYKYDDLEWIGNATYRPIKATCEDSVYAKTSLAPEPGTRFIDWRVMNHASDAKQMQGKSYGEFDLEKALWRARDAKLTSTFDGMQNFKQQHYTESVDLFSFPRTSKPIGKLHLKLKSAYVDGSYARVKLLDASNVSLAEPRVLYRAKDFPALLVFSPVEKRWIRITPENERPLWIDKNSLSAPMRHALEDRGKVFESASVIEITSPHRIRSAPTLDSEVLASVVSSVGTVRPLEVKGDWLKVHYTAEKPDGLFEKVLNQDYAGEPVNFEGWIKWRSEPGAEYVSPFYRLGM